MHFSLCDLVADLTQNSVEAAAKYISIRFIETDTAISISIEDNGKGMSTETLKEVQDPFFTDGIKHPNRKIGMGIPFLIQTANETNGVWNIDSKEGLGTTIHMRFDLKNIDTPPLGDVPGLFRQLLLFSGNFEMNIYRSKKSASRTTEYRLVKSELQQALGGLKTAADLALLSTFLESQEEN